MSNHPNQLGFDALLQEADQDNAAAAFDRETAHLPQQWEEALAFHKTQIAEHHAAMLANDFDVALRIRSEAHLLARKLNHGKAGILAGDDSPGCRLDGAARAEDGTPPLWGQSGVFDIQTSGLTARIEMGGMFGIGATAMPFLGLSARAVDPAKPFLSNTGYRSFLGVSVEPWQGITPEVFAKAVIEAFVANDLKGRLVRITPQ